MNCEYCEIEGRPANWKFCPECGEPYAKPEPLTLEQVRERAGKPVYFVYTTGRQFWDIVDGWNVAEDSPVWSDYEKILFAMTDRQSTSPIKRQFVQTTAQSDVRKYEHKDR